MNKRAERIRYVIQHKDGTFLNVRGEQKEDFMSVDRWTRAEDIHNFLRGHYAPDHPEDYHAQPIKVTYELEVEGDVQQK